MLAGRLYATQEPERPTIEGGYSIEVVAGRSMGGRAISAGTISSARREFYDSTAGVGLCKSFNSSTFIRRLREDECPQLDAFP